MADSKSSEILTETEELLMKFFDGEANASERSKVEQLVAAGDPQVEDYLADMGAIRAGVKDWYSSLASEVEPSYKPGYAWRAVQSELQNGDLEVATSSENSLAGFANVFQQLFSLRGLGAVASVLGLVYASSLLIGLDESSNSELVAFDTLEGRSARPLSSSFISAESSLGTETVSKSLSVGEAEPVGPFKNKQPNEETFGSISENEAFQGRELPKLSENDQIASISNLGNEALGDRAIVGEPGVDSRRIVRSTTVASLPLNSGFNANSSAKLLVDDRASGERKLLANSIAQRIIRDKTLRSLKVESDFRADILQSNSRGLVIWVSR